MAIKTPEKSQNELISLAGHSDYMYSPSLYAKKQAEAKRQREIRTNNPEIFELDTKPRRFSSPREQARSRILDQWQGLAYYGDPDKTKAIEETLGTLGDITGEVGEKALEVTTEALKNGAHKVMYEAEQVAGEAWRVAFGSPEDPGLTEKKQIDKEQSKAGIAEARAKVQAIKMDTAKAANTREEHDQERMVKMLADKGLSVEAAVTAAGGNQAQNKKNILSWGPVNALLSFLQKPGGRTTEIAQGGNQKGPNFAEQLTRVNSGHGDEAGTTQHQG